MAEEISYLYRGTTRGWPGNEILREEEITCTTTDPLVATLFAIECRSHGPAVVLVAHRNQFEGKLAPPNHFANEECAVNLMMRPAEFASHAVLSIEVDDSLAILAEMGFAPLPPRVHGQIALRTAILESLRSLIV